MIEITLDGQKVEVREGSMVMDAANKLGTYIPHFCYHKKLSIAANCRMCLVEVEKAPKPLPACATPVTAGMVVNTHSPKAIDAQKGVMEFLLINHPLDCPICDQGGECQLQDLAVGYGGSASRYKEEKRVVFYKDVGPLVGMEEMSRCIHCTRCVRFGQEIAGIMELGMIERGEFSEITTFVGKTIDSELSGNMIDICPVGALTSKPFRYSARTWELSRLHSISPHDSLGANLVVQVKNDRVMRVVPQENEDINECWLSDKDRFSYEGLNVAERLTQPMIKQDKRWIEVDWQQALDYVAQGLKSIAAQHGPAALGALATEHSTVEELHLLQKLWRGLGSENIDTRLRRDDGALEASLSGAPWLGMPITAVSALDRVLVVGSFLRKDQPLIAQRLRQAQKRGAHISIVHAVDDDLLIPLTCKAIVAPSAWVQTLAGVAAALAETKGVAAPQKADIDDNARAIAVDLAAGSRRAVLIGAAALAHPEARQLWSLAQWIAEASGATLGVLPEAANSVGAYLAGAHPRKDGLSASRQFAEPRRAYLLLNAEPELDAANPFQARAALEQADMVIAMSAFKHGALEYADVLLPISPFTETSGSFINMEGRVQSFTGVVAPLGQTRPAWKVLRVLGNLLGVAGFDYESSDAVRDELTQGKTELAERCSNRIGSVAAASPARLEAGTLERIADVPIHFADALVRRAPSLQQTSDAKTPRARLSAATASRFGLGHGEAVHVTQGPAAAVLSCEIDERVAAGCVRISCAHPLTATLGAMFGAISVEKVGAAT